MNDGELVALAVCLAVMVGANVWAHVGPALNGMMVIAVAFVLPVLNFTEKKAAWLGWIIVLDGWSNVVFYAASNFNQNRSLSFGDNKFGPSNVFSTIGLAPAYLFGVLALVALFIIGREALRNTRDRVGAEKVDVMRYVSTSRSQSSGSKRRCSTTFWPSAWAMAMKPPGPEW